MPGRIPEEAPLPLDTRRWTGVDVLVLIGLSGLLTLAFWEVMVQGRVFFFRDFALFFYPKRLIATEAVRNLTVPLWNSNAGCGEPVLGAYQSAVFYPPALIYYLLPMPQSFMWFVVFHFLLSGAGAYFMMRTWGARRIAAAFTAFAWAFSPAFISTVDNVSFLTSLSWMPWCLGFMKRIYLGRGYGAFLWLTITFAMAVLAGGPESVVFIAVAIAMYVVGKTVHMISRGGASSAWRPALKTTGAVALAAALSGVALVPFLYALKYSARQGGYGVDEADFWSAKPSDALLWFLPRFYLFPDRGGIYWRSQHWLKTVYMGVLIPFLALWTTAALRRRRNIFFAVAAAAFGVLALGKSAYVWEFLYGWLPGLSMVRFPVKFFLPAAFAMAVLAGFAVDDLMVLARKNNRNPARILMATLIVAGVVLGAAYLAARTWDEELFGKITPPQVLATEDGLNQAIEQYASAEWSLGRSAAFLLLGAGALALAARLTRNRIPRPYGGLALVIILFVDIGLFGTHLNPVAGSRVYTEDPTHLELVPSGVANSRLHMRPSLQEHLRLVHLARIHDLEGLTNYVAVVKGIRFQSDEELLAWLDRTSAPPFATTAEADEWLRTTNSSQFVTDLEYEVMKESFFPNVNLPYRVPMSEAFEPMSIKWHHDLLSRLRANAVPGHRVDFLPRMWGASMVIEQQMAPPGFAYRPMTTPGKRAILADAFVAVDTDSEAETLVAETPKDVLKTLVLFRDDAEAAAEHLSGAQAGEGAAGTATVTADTGNRVTVEVEAARPALLFLADNYYGMFRATVDGTETPIWRANYSYRAVAVPEGKHTVEFFYRPLDLYAGLGVTLAGVLALLAAGAAFKRAKKAADAK